MPFTDFNAEADAELFAASSIGFEICEFASSPFIFLIISSRSTGFDSVSSFVSASSCSFLSTLSNLTISAVFFDFFADFSVTGSGPKSTSGLNDSRFRSSALASCSSFSSRYSLTFLTGL